MGKYEKCTYDGLGVKTMSDLVLREIYGKYEKKNPTKNETKKYKVTEREILEKYDNLSKNELNKKENNEWTECQKWCYNQCCCALQR